MKITENNFIDLLKKSHSFIMQEAFSKVKNAKPVAVFEEESAIILQDKAERNFYYAQYEINEGFVNLSNIQKFEFEEPDYKEQIKEDVQNVFSSDSEKALKNLKASVRAIIKENSSTSDKISDKISSLLKEEVVSFVEKSKYQVKDLKDAKQKLDSLKENQYFKKFIASAEKKNLTPIIMEKIDWEKDTGKLYQNKFNFKTKEVINESTKTYSLKGFKKAQIIAKGYWKDQTFRKRLKECVEDTTKIKTFIERYKNITLLGEEAMKEDLSKALLAVKESNKISESLNLIVKTIKENYSRMLTWDKLNLSEGIPGEAPAMSPEAAPIDPSMAGGAEAGVTAPEAVTGDDIEIPEEPTEATEELGDESTMATEASGEVAIINSLLTTIEQIFWNGNQENKELANLIKELRDMRESGEFDEVRLEEIFKDLFAVTQQVETASEEEVGEQEIMAGEEESMGAESAPEAGEETVTAESPLDNY